MCVYVIYICMYVNIYVMCIYMCMISIYIYMHMYMYICIKKLYVKSSISFNRKNHIYFMYNAVSYL